MSRKSVHNLPSYMYVFNYHGWTLKLGEQETYTHTLFFLLTYFLYLICSLKTKFYDNVSPQKMLYTVTLRTLSDVGTLVVSKEYSTVA